MMAVERCENKNGISESARGEKYARLWLEFDLIDEAPHPVFARLDGLHDRMLRGMKMFGGVFVFG